MAGSGTTHLRDNGETLLRAENLVVEFPVGKTGLVVHAVSDVSLDVREGETLGLVGESGCGKSTTGRALMQLPSPTSGNVVYEGRDLTALPGSELRRVRRQMQLIFQDPISSLNPRRRVGDIVAEPLRIWASEENPPGGGIRLARNLLRFDAALRAALYLLWLLVLIVNELVPYLLGQVWTIAPGLDSWLRTDGLLLFVSCLVLAPASYALANAVRDRTPSARPLLAVEAIGSVLVPLLAALGGGLFSSAIGVVGLVGSVVLLVALLVSVASSKDFQTMAEVRAEHQRIVYKALSDVGIDPEGAVGRRPHQFSGGQCQRISIARALVLGPKLIICDEPVSALDVSVQAQILNLLEDMKQSYGLTLVFIAHDLAVVKNVSDRVAVMYLGKLCEVAPPDDLYQKPAHPYTAALLSSIPVPDPTRRPSDDNVLGGEIPSPVAPPSGCRFRTRCPKAQDLCAQVEPKMRGIGLGHYVACHFPLEVGEAAASGSGMARVSG